MGRRALPALILVVLVCLANLARAMLGPVDRVLSALPVLCPLRALTGFRCPSCGLGHAVFHGATGAFDQAFAHHPLGPVLLCAVAVYVVGRLCAPRHTEMAAAWLATIPHRWPGASLVLVAGYVLWGVIRTA